MSAAHLVLALRHLWPAPRTYPTVRTEAGSQRLRSMGRGHIPPAIEADGRPILPDEARDHLGRALRLALARDQDAPAYLGDPGLPPDLIDHVQRLRDRLRANEIGQEAVEASLRSFLTG